MSCFSVVLIIIVDILYPSMNHIVEVFEEIESSPRIRHIAPILIDENNNIQWCRVSFEWSHGWIEGSNINYALLVSLLKRVPLIVMEWVELWAFGSIHLSPSATRFQDPWHRDIFYPSESKAIAMKMPRWVSRSIPTLFSLESSVKTAISSLVSKYPILEDFLDLKHPFIIWNDHKKIRCRIQRDAPLFVNDTLKEIPHLQQYSHPWAHSSCVTSVLVRNSQDSPILHARQSVNRPLRDNPLQLFQIN